jgi:hypothetical protein
MDRGRATADVRSDGDEITKAFNDLRVAVIAESIAPRLLKVIPLALSVCHDYLDGSPPVKVPRE